MIDTLDTGQSIPCCYAGLDLNWQLMEKTNNLFLKTNVVSCCLCCISLGLFGHCSYSRLHISRTHGVCDLTVCLYRPGHWMSDCLFICLLSLVAFPIYKSDIPFFILFLCVNTSKFLFDGTVNGTYIINLIVISLFWDSASVEKAFIWLQAFDWVKTIA